MDALYSNTTGYNNTATGFEALLGNATGAYNTADGYQALHNNNTGNSNTATGQSALFNNTSGCCNTATGDGALYLNTVGSGNTAIGNNALLDNTGNDNFAGGYGALMNNGSGSQNTGVGFNALNANTTGNNNTALGNNAGSVPTTGSNNIHIGHTGVAGDANTIRIGTKGTQTKTFIAGIFGATTSGGIAVLVNSSGKLGTTTSSARFKENIHPMRAASDVLLSLRPVTFNYKPEIDPGGLPQFGLVAEDVEKIDPDLVVRDEEGKPYSVRYEAVNAMLLNEFLKEHRKVEALEATIVEQKKSMETFLARLKEQEAQIQRVSAQVEVSTAVPHVVANK
jgi:hypothetical protein